MEKLIGFFEEFWSASKPLPVVLFFFGVVSVSLSENVDPSMQKIISGTGVFLVVISLCLLIIRMWERANKNIVIAPRILDGFLMGLIAGLTAGFLGYGLHADGSLESVTLRTITVTVYSVSIGGLLGILLVLVQPENRSLMHSNYSLSILVAVALISVTVHISIDRMPVVDAGIFGWEIFIIFGTFTTLMLLKRAIEMRYRFSLVVSRILMSLALQIALMVVLLLVPAPNPYPEYSEFAGSFWSLQIYEGLRGSISFGMLLIFGAISQTAVYLIVLSNSKYLSRVDDVVARWINLR